MTLGILELAELDRVHDRLRAHDPGAAEALGLLERLLDVVYRDVESNVAFIPLGAAGDAAANP